MGKVVHYHPVSLTVIRAAVIYNGFRFGRIKQTKVNVAEQTAHYTCQIIEDPFGKELMSVEQLQTELQNCFAADIVVTNVWRTKTSRKWMCSLSVHLWSGGDAPGPETDLEWLIGDDDKVRSHPDSDRGGGYDGEYLPKQKGLIRSPF